MTSLNSGIGFNFCELTYFKYSSIKPNTKDTYAEIM